MPLRVELLRALMLSTFAMYDLCAFYGKFIQVYSGEKLRRVCGWGNGDVC